VAKQSSVVDFDRSLLATNERAQTMSEYAVILTVITLTIIVALLNVAQGILP
jgi:Flp pilus assembly pilin Flp